MSEPDVEAVIKAAQTRGRKAAPGVGAPPIVESAPVVAIPDPLPSIVANPFVDTTGKSLADEGQRE